MKGTVRKEGSSWYYLVCVGKDPLTKKYKYKKKRGFRTKKECEAALAQAIVEIEKGTLIDNEKMTVAEYLDYWLDTYVKNNCAASTYKRYKFSINDIKNNIGSIKLIKLNPLIIEKLYKDILEKTKQSQNSLLKTHRTFHLALKHAQQWQLISTNYCDLVNKPKQIKKDIEYWPPRNIKFNLKRLEGHILHDMAYLDCHTGLRVSELCALDWDYSVDLKKGIIKVRKQLQRIDGKLQLVDLKTPSSIRDIVLYPQTIEFLERLKFHTSNISNLDKYKRNKLGIPEEIENTNFVFHWKDGRPFDPHYVSQKFGEALDFCGVRDKITFHGLRHTHATMLLASGVNEKVISERLGHSTVSFTMDTYTHVNLELQQQEISKSSNFL